MLVLMVKRTMLSWMQVWPRSNLSFSRHDSVRALFRHAEARLRGDTRGRDDGFGVERYNNQDRRNYERLNCTLMAINYCSRQLLVPWSIVRYTTWHASSPFQRLELQRYSSRSYF